MGLGKAKLLPRKRELPSSLTRSVESLSVRSAGDSVLSPFASTSTNCSSNVSPEAERTDSIRLMRLSTS